MMVFLNGKQSAAAAKAGSVTELSSPCRRSVGGKGPDYRWRVGLLLLICLLAACTSFRPVVKIGLLAPFEGLHRRTGYEALAAMRAALAEMQERRVDLLPLALDSGPEPQSAQRATQKLLRDPSVQAIIGPLAPALLPTVGTAIPAQGPLWIVPFAAAPETTQFADPHTALDWATELIRAVAQAAHRQQAQRLVLAGEMAGWPQQSANAWSNLAQFPVVFSDQVGDVVATDAVLWLGSPEGAAVYLAAVRQHAPAIPFWLGPQGGDPVLPERSKGHGPLYWATWLGADYPQWAAQHTPATPTAYLVYHATRQAVAAITGQKVSVLPLQWQVTFFVIGEDGVSRLYRLPSGR